MSAAFSGLGPLLAGHVLLSAAAVALAILIGLPLALLAARRPVAGRVLLGAAGLIQTIPGLALLALFYPLLLALSALVGGRIPALGFLPALCALTLYALLPILRNGVAALAGIDRAVIQAAVGMGMTAGQRLRLVELPLAAPVLMAGIRTAAVWTIGAATLATTVGQPTLGNPIFAGLQTENWSLVLAGCVAAAGLAIVTDLALGLVESGLALRTRWRALAGGAILLAGIALALAPLAPEAIPASGGPRPIVTVGAKNFSEQYILARAIGARLERAGFTVRYREGLGSAIAWRALAAGDVDVYVDYSGTLWTGVMGRTGKVSRTEMVGQIGLWAARTSGVNVVGRLGFENAYALAMTGEGARKGGIRTLADLTPRSPSLSLGADLEFLNRPEWQAVRDAYSLRFRETAAYNPTFMYRALASGRADVISAFSSDGRIAADRLVVLDDPKGALPAYDALLLVSPAYARDARFIDALRPLIGAIPVDRMRQANYMVDRDAGKVTPDAAAAWLVPLDQ
ncbi:ABC transporter permease/substrate-binding protein [Sphingomonas naphthae]|uniref:ABC transporter permease/substrate-binding protein n=1 Tax=Sphingomonas naphthae TaxID=1813468 RepID=A0ABY7TJR1_9SPHN|nr:ABC transporter permease/substrate-binding protein [Sphingomonas naphthae]WCT73016.1 ABC transporter permease/substrate-binding protein [Sphingomonas naphthae]